MIVTQDEGYVRTVILNDPSSQNSLSEGLARAVLEALTEASEDGDVRAVILTAQGKVFCSGGNLKELKAITGDRGNHVGRIMDTIYNPLAGLLASYPKPLLVALNGPAIGAGVGLALNADFVIAAKGAFFTLPFVPRLSIMPDMGSGWLLVRSLGYRRALSLCLTGEKLKVEEALESGLVYQICEPEELLACAVALANQLGGLSRSALSHTRQLLRRAELGGLQEQLVLERDMQVSAFREPAFEEGLAAYFEGREPDFKRFD